MKKSLQTINSQIALPEQCQLLVKHYKCIFDWFLVNYGIQTIQGNILILEVLGLVEDLQPSRAKNDFVL